MKIQNPKERKMREKGKETSFSLQPHHVTLGRGSREQKREAQKSGCHYALNKNKSCWAGRTGRVDHGARSQKKGEETGIRG